MTEEDEHLWENTARSLAPLKRAKPRVRHAVEPDDTVAPPLHVATASPNQHDGHHLRRHPSRKLEPESVPAIPRPVPDLSAFDAKKARKIRSGRAEIEARIDLHGMRQSEAHAALRRFLLSCFGRGVRLVLVITGKGSPSRRILDDSHDPHDGYHERGVLKRNVPMWLAEPEVRAIVVSYTTAAVQHGGEGALYVHLRNPERVHRKG